MPYAELRRDLWPVRCSIGLGLLDSHNWFMHMEHLRHTATAEPVDDCSSAVEMTINGSRARPTPTRFVCPEPSVKPACRPSGVDPDLEPSNRVRIFGSDRELLFERALLQVARRSQLPGAMIVVLHAPGSAPSYSVAMPRSAPGSAHVKFVLSARAPELARIVRLSLTANPAYHDGALLVTPSLTRATEFVITGWSFRLFPPPCAAVRRADQGSAYNTAFDYSAVPGVLRAYSIGPKTAFAFEAGAEVRSWRLQLRQAGGSSCST